MYTAEQAREDVKKYEDNVRINTLENLLNIEDNNIALQLFESEIESLALKGNTSLFLTKTNSELYELIDSTNIITILKFLGYKITTNYNNYTISW